MNILMLTNVYTPQVGGVTRSIQQFTHHFRKQGHRVVIVAPDYREVPSEKDVIRVSAIPEFYDDRYSLPLPLIPQLIPGIADFDADIVHAHHPFFLGTTGQTIAAQQNAPLIYTHHTRYSQYIEQKTNWPRAFEDAVHELIINYCNLCDVVIAPSDGIRGLLREAHVQSQIVVIPTGVDCERFQNGGGAAARAAIGIPQDAFVVGHVGRLAPEKNCPFLCDAVGRFLRAHSSAWFLVVGEGNEREGMETTLNDLGVGDRVRWTGPLQGRRLADAYSAMDVFAFASHTETQGMVLAEAMAAGVPVVAVHGTGVSDLVENDLNGWLIPRDDAGDFVSALERAENVTPRDREQMRESLNETANRMSMKRCATRMLRVYRQAIAARKKTAEDSRSNQPQGDLRRTWSAAWSRWKNRIGFIATATKGLVNRGGKSRPMV